MMPYEIQIKISDEDFDKIDKSLSTSFYKSRGLWYPVDYGIKDMKEAVYTLGSYTRRTETKDYDYRIIEVHYQTRSCKEKANEDEI